jgi:hypothetical protein
MLYQEKPGNPDRQFYICNTAALYSMSASVVPQKDVFVLSKTGKKNTAQVCQIMILHFGQSLLLFPKKCP